MNAKTTIVLVALLVLVASYLYFVEFNAPPPPTGTPSIPTEISPDGEPLLPPNALAGVNRIDMELPDDEAVTVERVGTGWSQTAPVTFPFNPSDVELLISTAGNLRYVEALDVNTLNEDNPQRAVITFSGGEGEPVELVLGRQTIAGRGYIMRPGDPVVYVVNDALHTALLDQPYRNMRQTTLKAPLASNASAITLTTPGHTIDLTKADGRWLLDRDPAQRADESAVDNLARGVGSARIKNFIEDEPSSMTRFGLDEPEVVITLTTPGVDDQPDTPHTLRIGAPADMESKTYYATWSPSAEPSRVVFTLDAADRERLLVKPDALRDPRVLPIKTLDIRRVLIGKPAAAGTPPWEMRRTPDGFTLEGSDETIDLIKADDLLQSIVGLRGAGFVHEPVSTTPAAVVEIDADGAYTLSLHPGETDEALWVVKRDDEPYGYLIEKAELEPILTPDIVHAPDPAAPAPVGDNELVEPMK